MRYVLLGSPQRVLFDAKRLWNTTTQVEKKKTIRSEEQREVESRDLVKPLP